MTTCLGIRNATHWADTRYIERISCLLLKTEMRCSCCCHLYVRCLQASSWDQVEITLNRCTDRDILCGIDTQRSNVGRLMNTLSDTYFRHMFRQLVYSLLIILLLIFYVISLTPITRLCMSPES